mmetsp:Transcript_121362/g.339837  ORF Transcript_121362/g.339837 Transcript_121362/m.339837 type:complete len:357 (-) Transcript_121362:253-1323(-)
MRIGALARVRMVHPLRKEPPVQGHRPAMVLCDAFKPFHERGIKTPGHIHGGRRKTLHDFDDGTRQRPRRAHMLLQRLQQRLALVHAADRVELRPGHAVRRCVHVVGNHYRGLRAHRLIQDAELPQKRLLLHELVAAEQCRLIEVPQQHAPAASLLELHQVLLHGQALAVLPTAIPAGHHLQHTQSRHQRCSRLWRLAHHLLAHLSHPLACGGPSGVDPRDVPPGSLHELRRHDAVVHPEHEHQHVVVDGLLHLPLRVCRRLQTQAHHPKCRAQALHILLLDQALQCRRQDCGLPQGQAALRRQAPFEDALSLAVSMTSEHCHWRCLVPSLAAIHQALHEPSMPLNEGAVQQVADAG